MSQLCIFSICLNAFLIIFLAFQLLSISKFRTQFKNILDVLEKSYYCDSKKNSCESCVDKVYDIIEKD